MSSDLLRSVELQQQKEDIGLKSDLARLRVGDDVQVHYRIVEGDRERIQLVRGTILRMRKGAGANASFTVKRLVRSTAFCVTWALSSRWTPVRWPRWSGNSGKAGMGTHTPLTGSSTFPKKLKPLKPNDG